jgi:hypothetical protein
MSQLGTEPAHLRRIADEQSMRRSCSISIELTLFGTPAVFREWGALDRAGVGGSTSMVARVKPLRRATNW